MKINKPLPFKRKKKGITNYCKRLASLKSGMPRAVVRRSLRNIIAQLVDYNTIGDKILMSADSKELKKFGWNANTGNTPAAYLTGYLLGNRARKAKIEKIILDIGLHTSTKGARVYATLKGIIDAGLNIAYGKECLPSEERLSGKHIQAYAQKLQKEDNEKYQKHFGGYLKAGLDPTKIETYFSQVKERIAKEAPKNG